jgi:hypothetical protein
MTILKDSLGVSSSDASQSGIGISKSCILNPASNQYLSQAACAENFSSAKRKDWDFWDGKRLSYVPCYGTHNGPFACIALLLSADLVCDMADVPQQKLSVLDGGKAGGWRGGEGLVNVRVAIYSTITLGAHTRHDECIHLC